MTKKIRAYSVRIGAAVGTAKNLVAVKTGSSCSRLTKSCTWPVIAITWLIFLTIVFASALVTVTILYFQEHPVEICETEECLRIAKSFKETMDITIDPCEDFYNFACGKWSQSHPVSCASSGGSVTWFDFMEDDTSKTVSRLLETNFGSNILVPVQQAKILYSSCLRIDRWEKLGLEPLYSLLKLLGLPIDSFTNAPNTTSTFLASLVKVHRTMNLDVFFRAKVSKKQDLLQLTRPSLSGSWAGSGIVSKKNGDFSFEDSYKNHEKNYADERKDNYKNNTNRNFKFINDITTYVLRNAIHKTHPNASSEELEVLIKKTVKTIYNIENTIKAIQRKQFTESRLTVNQLEDVCDQTAKKLNITIEPLWRPFIELLFQDLEAFDFENDVVLTDVSYLWRITIVISQNDKKDLTTYLWWIVVKHSVPYLTHEVQKLYYNYRDKTSLKSEKYCQRYIRCGKIVSELMGKMNGHQCCFHILYPSVCQNCTLFSLYFLSLTLNSRRQTLVDKAVFNLYMKEYLQEPLMKKEEIKNIFHNLKLAFNTSIENISWLDDETKKAVSDKVEKVAALIGFPVWILNETQLMDYYNGVNISSQSFLANAVSAVKKRTEHSLLKAVRTRVTEDDEWWCSVLQINAFHVFSLNKITIPFGIIKFPYYENGLKVLNYAGIGMIIGHEILHGLDTKGILFDENGEKKTRWTGNSRFDYNQRVDCFIRDYDSFYEPMVDRYVNGALTIDENIADNGGLNIAFKAYQAWVQEHGTEPFLPGFTNLTHEQLFFLGYGHNWCESYGAAWLNDMLNDVHPPQHVRMEMVVRNSEDFSRAWKCPAGSKMNPKKKCHLW